MLGATNGTNPCFLSNLDLASKHHSLATIPGLRFTPAGLKKPPAPQAALVLPHSLACRPIPERRAALPYSTLALLVLASSYTVLPRRRKMSEAWKKFSEWPTNSRPLACSMGAKRFRIASCVGLSK